MNSKRKYYTETQGQKNKGNIFYSCFMLLRAIAPLCLCVTLFCIISCTEKLKIQEIFIERDGEIIASVKAEIARTDQERSQGLMYRKKLPDGEGMLFIFEKDQILSFWMKNTYIPLSIAYINFEGIIIDIKDMFAHDQNPVLSSRSVRFALEVPQGWFTRAGVKQGDTVKLDGIN